jgi:hypothetical protein
MQRTALRAAADAERYVAARMEFMRYYTLCTLDQPKTSWVLHDIIKKVKSKKNPEMPPAFYKFFPPPDAEVHMKERYQPLCCPKCGKYDSDAVFKAGFEEPVAIRFKQDLGLTDDRQVVMNNKCLAVLKAAKVGGFETKPIGKSGWHVLKVTLRVACNEEAYVHTPPECEACGRFKGGGGILWRERDIKAPAKPNTFFTTKSGWASKYLQDRSVFLTEDVYAGLKAGTIKGPHCDRLQSDEEIAKREELQKQGKNWVPQGLTVYLSGK